MRPRPLLLDLDGTLVDSLPDIHASTNDLRASFGLEPVPLLTTRGWIGDGTAVLMMRALAELGPFETVCEQALQRWCEHHAVQCTQLSQPYPGVAEQLRRWHTEGQPMAVVTNKGQLFTERILAHLGLDRWLQVAICGDTLEQKKPDPTPLLEALRQLGVPAAGAAICGDGLQDLRAGKAAGLRTIAALYGYRPEAVLRAEGADVYWRAFGKPAR